MDSYQQPHRYIGPPAPPSSADPYHHQPRPPLPPNGPLFSGQFQYPPPSHSPSPSTSQWVPSSLPPPPPPPPPGSYAPPPYSYPSPIVHHAQFPPPRPHVVAHLPPHSQVPQSYCQGNQEWSSSNWTPHQGWDYAANKGEEDWAAKARAWADAKNAMENQHSQSQFAPVGRVEEKSQYPQAVYSHFPDYQHQPPPPLNYEKFSVALQPVHRPAITHYQEPASVSSESSYAPDGHQPRMGYDRSLGGDTSASLHHQKSLSTGPSVHQQEVPSSYSSVAGKQDTADQNEWSYKLSASQNSSVKEGEPPMHQPMPTSYSFGNQSAVPSTNLADQPLDFTPRFSHDHDMSATYAYHNSVGHAGNIESVASISSLNSWPPPPPGMVYPSISPVLSSGSQHDPSIALPSVSGHTAPSFGRIAGPGLSSAAPLGAVPFDLSAGTALPPIVFSNDTYGIANMSDRPKKAAVPNWLKEEIKKAVISTSTVELSKERTQLMEDEGFDKSSTKDDQTDTKSVDSFRSTEEGDEDDEDSIQAARNAAINQEIKRLLTEVLLKVTDALFDEIATKVISEDDLSVEVSQSALSSNQILSPAPLQAPTPKAFAKVLVPSKAKEPDSDSNSEKSNSSFQGDLLGLANYASDEDLPISNAQNTANNSAIQQSNGKRILDNRYLETGNGNSLVDRDDKGRSQMNIESSATKSSSTIYDKDNSSAFSELNSTHVDKERGQQYSLMPGLKDGFNGGINESQKVSGNIESRHPRENVIHEKSPKSSQGKEVPMKVDKNGRVENTIISSGKDHFNETETSKKRKDEKGNENRNRQDEKHLEREKTVDLKDRMKEKDVETGKKEKQSESRKRHGSYEAKDERKDSDRLHKSSARDGNDSKRESAKGKEEDRARQKNSSETSKHKSKNSSSNTGKARSSNENKCSSDGSDISKRKPYSRKRTSSPSPDRSKRRQVSRSPHSKHSQRRHSPYSSFDGARGRRSRSRSPVRRQR